MLFLSGSGDIVSLAGGADTITDSGSGNTYILPAAGNGTDAFTSNILAMGGDTLDLKTALAATNWNGSAATLANYVTVTDSAKGATLLISATSGGVGSAIATIAGANSTTLTSLLTHSIT
jgi:NADPH-dependent curcumin reductase CurA